MMFAITKGGAMGRLLLVLMFVLTACQGGWDKDAFSGESDRIKNAQKPTEKQKIVPPPDFGSISIDMDSVYSVLEGETLEIPVKYKLIHPEVRFESISVKGLEENFPGGFYDTTNSKIVLRPAYDFVPVDVNYIVANLTVSFLTRYKGQLNEVQKNIAVHVIPENTAVPDIADFIIDGKSIQGFGAPNIRLGTKHKVEVRVRDVDKEYTPRLQIFDASTSYVFGSQFFDTSKPGEYSEDLGMWVFNFDLELPKDFHLTSAGRSGTLEVYAYSITGIPSRGKRYHYKVYPDARPALVIAEDRIYFRVNEATDYTFSVFDPWDRGQVSARCVDEPKGMECTCSPGSGEARNVYFCTLKWVPDQEAELKMKLVGRNVVNTGAPLKEIVETVKEVTLQVGGQRD